MTKEKRPRFGIEQFDDDRIAVWYPWDSYLNDEIRSYGGKWSREDKAYIVGNQYEDLIRCGFELVYGPGENGYEFSSELDREKYSLGLFDRLVSAVISVGKWPKEAGIVRGDDINTVCQKLATARAVHEAKCDELS